MTNFEKWKQGLTVEQAAYEMSCNDCPARKSSCPSDLCVHIFRRWAESEAEE